MSGRGRMRGALSLLALGLAVGLSGCDNIVKMVPWFSTMSKQPAVQMFEEAPRAAPVGTRPVGAYKHYDLLAADSMLTNPLPTTSANIARGKVLFDEFCLMCHGPAGQGNGPVLGPRRIPKIPTANLMSERARNLSDGYYWGMIENGRGLMPEHSQIPPYQRWYIIEYVRDLQRQVSSDSAGNSSNSAKAK